MTHRFELCLKRVLLDEGGKADDPVDRGGRTNCGVTQRVYDDYRRSRGHPPLDVWSMSDAECKDVYFARYWVPLQCGVLPVGLDYVVFDAGVNSGITRSAKWLQTALGLADGEVDGLIGQGTLRHVQDVVTVKQVDMVIANCLAQRRKFLQDLIARKPVQRRFAKGWENRIAGVEKHAEEDRA